MTASFEIELETICNRAVNRVQRDERAKDAYSDWRHIVIQQLRAAAGQTHEPAALWIDAQSMMRG